MERVMKIFSLSLLVACGILFLSCGGSPEVQKSDPRRLDGPKVKYLTGTMRFLDIEGGCWQFVADDGKTYELVGRAIQSILEDGLKVSIEIRPAGSLGSTCMAGEVVEVVKILDISESE